MDPTDLSEYLLALMEGVADNLTIRQREELAAAIYNFGMSLAVARQTWVGPDWLNIPSTLETRGLSACHPDDYQ